MRTEIPPQAHHGALNYSELTALGIDPSQVLDFSSNINPYDPTPSVLKAVQGVNIRPYPDRDSLDLKRQISNFYDIPIENIMLGNGASELIWLLCFTLLKPGDTALVLAPTFGEYARCVKLMGAEIVSIDMFPGVEFAKSFNQVKQSIGSIKPKLVFFCNPNNPTGEYIDPSLILALVDENPQSVFVLDEAYIDFTSTPHSLIGNQRKNLLVLRSLTKYYSLAGVRLGFIAGNPEIIAAITDVRPAWNINAVAQAAGTAAITSHNELKDSIINLTAGKKYLTENLTHLGYTIFPSDTHYFLVHIDNGAKFRQRLLVEHQIQVRDCASFGLPEYVRISAQLPEDNRQIIQAIQSITQDF